MQRSVEKKEVADNISNVHTKGNHHSENSLAVTAENLTERINKRLSKNSTADYFHIHIGVAHHLIGHLHNTKQRIAEQEYYKADYSA